MTLRVWVKRHRRARKVVLATIASLLVYAAYITNDLERRGV